METFLFTDWYTNGLWVACMYERQKGQKSDDLDIE